MKTVKIGNSYGIIIPKPLLEKYDLKNGINLIETDAGLLLQKVENRREGWSEAFRKANENGEFEDIPDILDDDVFEEYSPNNKRSSIRLTNSLKMLPAAPESR